MNFCPNCGNAKQGNFCGRCGYAFTEIVSTIVPVPQTTELTYGDGYSPETNCFNCGKKRTKGSTACKLCGQDL